MAQAERSREFGTLSIQSEILSEKIYIWIYGTESNSNRYEGWLFRLLKRAHGASVTSLEMQFWAHCCNVAISVSGMLWKRELK